MNISSLNQIKEDDVFIFYTLSDKEVPNLWVGDSDKADEIANIIMESHQHERGFSIFRGAFSQEEHAEHYLALVQTDEGIRMHKGNWENIIDFFNEEKNQQYEMRVTIPLLKKTKKQEEVEQMSKTKEQSQQALTGTQVITSAKTGELFVTISKPQVVITRDEEGVLIYNDTKDGVIINNEFLNELFVPYAELKAPKRDYITLQQALKAFVDGEHIHVDIFEPNGEVNEDICLNQFLPVSEAIMEIKEEEGTLILGKFLKTLKRDLDSGVKEAAELMKPINANIPMEILVYGKFFIEHDED